MCKNLQKGVKRNKNNEIWNYIGIETFLPNS